MTTGAPSFAAAVLAARAHAHQLILERGITVDADPPIADIVYRLENVTAAELEADDEFRLVASLIERAYVLGIAVGLQLREVA